MEGLTRLCRYCCQAFPVTEFKVIRRKYRGHRCRICRNTQERARHLKSGKTKVTRAQQRPFIHPVLGAAKRCPICEIVKPINEFKIDRGKPTACRLCLRNRSRVAYKQNPERHRQYFRNYSAKNRNGINQRQNQRRRSDPEGMKLIYQKSYQRRRKENIEYQKRYRAAMTPEQKERVRILARLPRTACEQRRRAAKTGSQASRVNLKEILKRDGATCYLCNKVLNPAIKGEITFDHVVPLSKGGAHTAENLRVACLPCNTRKGNRSLEEFYKLHRLALHPLIENPATRNAETNPLPATGDHPFRPVEEKAT